MFFSHYTYLSHTLSIFLTLCLSSLQYMYLSSSYHINFSHTVSISLTLYLSSSHCISPLHTISIFLALHLTFPRCIYFAHTVSILLALHLSRTKSSSPCILLPMMYTLKIRQTTHYISLLLVLAGVLLDAFVSSPRLTLGK